MDIIGNKIGQPTRKLFFALLVFLDGTENNVQFVVEESDEQYAGVIVDISIRKMFKQNRCEVPTN